MKAGKLDQVIEIRRPTLVDDGWGNQTPGAPETIATMRAHVIKASTEEFFRAWGTTDETAVVFRLRFIDDVRTSDQIRWDSVDFDIKEITEIGRRRGVELRCVSVAS